MENPRDTDISIYLTSNPHITFGKNTYKRHTDCFQKKISNNLYNNRIIIEPFEYPIDIIKNMWLTECDKIKCFSMFLVDESIDINQLTTDSVNEDNNIQIIHKMSINSLYSLNKLHKLTFKSNVLEIIYNNMNFIPKLLIKDNKKIVLVIETNDGSILNDCKLMIKYLILYDNDEIRRFQQVAHEYLCRRLITKKYKINKGDNKILLETNNLCISHFIINTPKNISDKLKIIFNSYIKQQNENNINDDNQNTEIIIKNENILDEINYDIEYNYYQNENNDTYIYDAYDNITNYDYQPRGHIQLQNESNLTIQSDSNEEIEFEITFSIYDVLRLGNGNIEFATQYIPPINQNPTEELPNNDVDNGIIEPPINIPVNVPQQSDNIEKDKITNYTHILLKFLRLYELLTAKRHLLNEDENICLITLEKIKYGGIYYACERCHKPFSYESYKHWFIHESSVNMCPHCRMVIYNYPQLYINKKSLVEYKKEITNYIVEIKDKIIHFITRYD